GIARRVGGAAGIGAVALAVAVVVDAVGAVLGRGQHFAHARAVGGELARRRAGLRAVLAGAHVAHGRVAGPARVRVAGGARAAAQVGQIGHAAHAAATVGISPAAATEIVVAAASDAEVMPAFAALRRIASG